MSAGVLFGHGSRPYPVGLPKRLLGLPDRADHAAGRPRQNHNARTYYAQIVLGTKLPDVFADLPYSLLRGKHQNQFNSRPCR